MAAKVTYVERFILQVPYQEAAHTRMSNTWVVSEVFL